MKDRISFLAALVLILTISLAIYSRIRVEGETTDPQSNEITVTCPDKIQVGPLYVAEGWQSLGSLPWPRISIRVDTSTQSVVCEYGNKENLLFTFFIGQKIPTGYDCKIPGPGVFQAVCTRRTGNRTRH